MVTTWGIGTTHTRTSLYVDIRYRHIGIYHAIYLAATMLPVNSDTHTQTSCMFELLGTVREIFLLYQWASKPISVYTFVRLEVKLWAHLRWRTKQISDNRNVRPGWVYLNDIFRFVGLCLLPNWQDLDLIHENSNGWSSRRWAPIKYFKPSSKSEPTGACVLYICPYKYFIRRIQVK